MKTLINQRTKKYFLPFVILALALFLAGCKTIPPVEDYSCRTRFPILLVHGLGIRDDFSIFPSWADIPEILSRSGAEVYTSGQNAFDSIEKNARILKETIIRIIETSGHEKVNIISHSKGGLEARFAVSVLGLSPYVASVTTLCTPHRGAWLADEVLEKKGSREDFLYWIADVFAFLLGDSSPDSFSATMNLTRDYMERFNNRVHDVQGVYYQSYSSSIGEDYSMKILRDLASEAREEVGDNDGVVSVESAAWGVFCGVLENSSHLDMIGQTSVTGNTSFNYQMLYMDLVQDLVQKGF